MTSLGKIVSGQAGPSKAVRDGEMVVTAGFGPPDDSQVTSSGFIPMDGLAIFYEKYGAITGPKEATGVWVKYKPWKTKMAVHNDETITVQPSVRAKYEVVNTFRYPMRPLVTSDMTLKRLSGYSAVMCFESIKNATPLEIKNLGIINPIAESIGIKCEEFPLLYCAAANGAEMFPEFGMYSFFLQLYRHQKLKTQDTERTVLKMMRMKYNGLPLNEYLEGQSKDVKKAWDAVTSLPWKGNTRPKKEIIDYLEQQLKIDISDLR
ncbi:MAG: nucleoprotein [Udune virus]|uniref:Nucleoprotein n=1 Tax=Udune virus TaxID=2800946 RepID=A0A894KND6_9VIRU|nr:MAG: nucleoprotein [Udune virus]